MPHIVFTHSYFYPFDAKQWKNKQPYPPYGTLYAAALMRETGFGVSLFDVALRDNTDGLAEQLRDTHARYLVIYDDGFNYLTKMCLTRMREAAFEMARLGKAAGATVIVCSSDSTDHYEQYLGEGADFVIRGEGEITLRALVQALESGNTDFSGILGIAYGHPVRVNPPRPVIKALDELPDPAWDLVDMQAYRRIWMRHHGYFSLNMATTRGCPYKCNWCAKPIYGNRYNSRSPERVAAEAELLVKTHGATHFWMADDIFGLKPGWVQGFRDALRRRGLNIPYKIQSRVDLLLQEDNIDALVASGLRQVWVGAESGSQKVLDAMDKGTKVAEIHAATAILKKKGVEVCFFLQFGYLGESRSDIDETLQMVEQLVPHDIGISVSYPLPGTKFYDKVKGLLGEKQNWEVSDDLAMMYPATFPPGFYKRLHRLVHKRFRLRQGMEALQELKNGHVTNWKRALKVLYYAPAARVDAWRLAKWEAQT
jgi:anaerobic magnesium-protoporphyrin IX monomethyl ester cyclase